MQESPGGVERRHLSGIGWRVVNTAVAGVTDLASTYWGCAPFPAARFNETLHKRTVSALDVHDG